MPLYDAGGMPEDDGSDEEMPQFNERDYISENPEQLFDRFIVPTERYSVKYTEIERDGKKYLIKEPTKYVEIFKPDMTTSNLKDFGLWSVQEAGELAIGIKEFADQNELDLSRAANFFAYIMYLELNTSKGVKLELLRAIRTSRQESSSSIEKTQRFDQQKKKWGIF